MVPQLAHMRKIMTASWCAVGIFLAGITANTAQAECTYIVDGDWHGGFNAKIRVKNDTATTVTSWSVDWEYSGDNRITHAWNVNFSGTNPYSASNLSWNGLIHPGDYVDFPLQGTKVGALPAEVPTISGSLCSTSVPVVGDSVFIQVDRADDYVFLFVDGIEKMRWGGSDPSKAPSVGAADIRIGEKIDITHLFAEGNNEVRILSAADNWGSLIAHYDVRLWVDSTLVVDKLAYIAAGNEIFAPLVLDESVTVVLGSSAPAKRTLTVTSPVTGDAIYINNVFTGKHTPATFDVAPGEYRVGLGRSTSAVNPLTNNSEFTGEYREQDIEVTTTNVTVDAATVPVLTQKNHWKIGVVPYAEIHFGLTEEDFKNSVLAASNNVGVLTEDDIVVALAVAQTTSNAWLLPISYGLMEWQLTLLPTVTDRVYYTTTGFLVDDDMIAADINDYDMILHVMPNRTVHVNSSGERFHVINDTGGWADGKHLFVPQSWMDAKSGLTLTQRLANIAPSSGLLHESLHVYDQFRWNDYNGVEQVHGAEEHGYIKYECGYPEDWICMYRDYIRSQIGENTSNMHTVTAIDKLAAEDVAVYVGVFNSMRGGRGANQYWNYAKPLSYIRNTHTLDCLDLSGGLSTEGNSITPWSCQSSANQVWSVRRVMNESYHLVNNLTQKCAAMGLTGVEQRTCSAKPEQRFILKTKGDGTFSIQTADGECLAVNTSSNLVAEICNNAQLRQFWEYVSL